MTLKTLVLAIALLAGCGKPKPPIIPITDAERGVEVTSTTILPGGAIMQTLKKVPPPSHEAQVYAELWRACKERHHGVTNSKNCCAEAVCICDQ